MKNKTVVSAFMALSLLSGSAVFAQGHGRDDHGSNDRGDDRRPDRRHDNRPDGRRDDHRDERGFGPQHAWHRGDRLPPEYRNRQYVVDDWRGHRLSPPPRGYHWVQTGGDYALVAISTGIILNFLLNN